MKKILPLILVLMLMGSIASLALADKASNNPSRTSEDDDDTNEQTNQTSHNHNSTDDNETEHEVEIMNNTLGAEIRLLQLEKAIMVNLLKGIMAVQVLKGLDVNTTQLESILGNLKDVLAEVRAANPAANDSVQIFVELKNESRNLTKQFREAIKSLLDKDTIQRIKEQLRNLTSDEIQNCSAKLRHRIRQFNSNQLYRLYGIFGETNTTLIKEYLGGNITLNQTKLQLYKLINHLTKEKRYQIFSEVKEENIKKKIHAHTSLEDLENHGNHGNGKGRGD